MEAGVVLSNAWKPRGLRIGLLIAISILAGLMVSGCASQQRSGRGGIGKPPREQAPVVYRQSRQGPLITPENDPFAAR